MRKTGAVSFLLLFASPAIAGNLSVRVVDQAGRPVNDAVVTIDPIGRPAQPARVLGPYRIRQHKMMFHPFVSVVPVGATVDFPNLDATRHHVYSFSPAKRFELKLFARDQTRSIRVDKAGVIAIGCNIHDQMSAFLFVSATRWAQRTERGAATFRRRAFRSFEDHRLAPLFADARPHAQPDVAVRRRRTSRILHRQAQAGAAPRHGQLLMRPFRIRTLNTRLSLLFAGLFAAVMLSVSMLLFAMVERIARAKVEQQLVASGAVFDRLWQQRSLQMQDAAKILARDFGFRAAVATGDQATAASALDNLKRRLDADLAVIVGVDASVHGDVSPAAREELAALWGPLDAGRMSGVARIDGQENQIVAAPILTPVLIGWILFASTLDANEMRSLEKLSAIPLHAGVIVKRDGRWSRVAGAFALVRPCRVATD